MGTPKADWTSTSDMVQWAEDVASFLLREKSNAQKCLHDCERLLMDANVTSDSLREGLRELMCRTEENYGTLLHLERVLNMKNCGDEQGVSRFSKSSAAIGISKNQSSSIMIAASAPNANQVGRFRQQRVRSVDFGDDLFQRHRQMPKSNENEENFDPLEDDFKETELNREDADEKLDDFDDDSGFEAAYLSRNLDQASSSNMMAKSLPVKVPFLRKMSNSPPDLEEDTQDIPTKMAELARSLLVDSIGELPPRRMVE